MKNIFYKNGLSLFFLFILLVGFINTAFAQIPTIDLGLWLKADAGVTLAIGVSTWADQSVNGRDATQVAAVSQPSYVPSEVAINNQPVIRFDGNDHLSFDGSFMAGGDYTVFLVGATNTSSGWFVGGTQNASNQMFAIPYENNRLTLHQWGNDLVGSVSCFASKKFEIISGSSGNSGKELKLNGSVIASNTNTDRLVSFIGAALGKRENTLFLNGDIAEFIVYRRTLSAAEYLQVETYLQTKYAIPLNVAQPTTQSSVSASVVASTTATLNLSAGNGTGRIILISTSPISTSPADLNLSTIIADATFGSGTAICLGQYVAYTGNGTSVNLTGLSPNTTYYAKAFEYNGSGNTTAYNLTSSPINNATSFTTPPIPTQPQGNRGLYFDGVNDYVNIGSSSKINFSGSNDFTIEMWVKSNGKGNVVLYEKTAVVGTPNTLGIWTQINTDGTVAFSLGKEGVTWDVITTTTSDIIQINRWTHLAFEKQGSTSRIYIDGVLKVSGNLPNASTALIDSSPANLGRFRRDNAQHFGGQIDEFRLSNSARYGGSSFTIQDSYVVDANTILYYPMNEAAQTISDQAATPLNASLGADLSSEVTDPLRALRVTDNTDNGSAGLGSLRQAINEANTDNNTNYIDFSIQQDGSLSTIFINSTLDVNQPILLDGYSAMGSTLNTLTGLTNGTNAALKVELKGSAAFKALTGTHYALRFPSTGNAQNSTVKGLVINDFKLTSSASDDGAIRFMRDGCKVLGCFIGTDVTGTTLIPNTIGVGSSGNNILVGTANAGDRNLIAGGINAIQFNGGIATSTCKAQNNLVGVGANLTPLSGTTYGVLIFSNGNSANNNLIGGTGLNEGNVIANYQRGVLVDGNATGNRILGNSIYNNSMIGIALTGTPQGNGGKQPPSITLATPSAISGICSTCAVGDTIEVFTNVSTPTQGQTYVGSTTVALGGLWTLGGTFNPSDIFSATATDLAGNTSPFGFILPTYYSRVTTGNWSNGTTWSTSSHTGGSCGCTPPTGANVQIAAGHTITRDIPIYSNIITLAGTLDLGEDAMPYTIATITNSVGNGKLRIGGANSASSITPATTTGTFFTTPSNVVEFYGDASYAAPARDYPSIALTHTLLATPWTIINVSGSSFTIYGNINGSANTDFNVNPDVTFSTTLGTHSLSGNMSFYTTNINGNTTISSGLINIRNNLTIVSGVTLTNNANLQIDGSSVPTATLTGSGIFTAGSGSNLYYNSDTPIGLMALNFEVDGNTNNVFYTAGAVPLVDTYHKLIFRGSSRTMSGTINAKIIELESNAILNLAGGAVLNQTGVSAGENFIINTGSSLNMNDPTNPSTVTVNGDLMTGLLPGGTINVGSLSSVGAAHVLDLKGANNALGTYEVVNMGPANSNAIIKYSGTVQQVFASPNYQNLEIAGGGIKSLQGDVTVNKELKLTLGVLDISNSPVSNLIIGQNATIVNGGGLSSITDFNIITSYITTSGGVLKKEFSSPLSNFVFPIGETGKYAPMVANMTSYTAIGMGVSTLSVKPITGNQTNLVSTTNALNKYWATYTTNVSTINGDLKFYYDDTEVRAALANEPNYISGYYTGSAWVLGNTAAVNEATNEIAFTGLTGDWGNRSWTAGELSAFIPTYYSNDATAGVGSVDWNLSSTWTLGSHSGTAPTVPPPAGATVIIAPNHTIDVNTTAINVGSLSLGGELNLRNVPSHTITTLNNNGGAGNLIFEGTNSADSLPSIIATSYKAIATNKITFGGAAYTIPQTNYPTLIIDGTGIKIFASPPSIPIDISGDLLVVGTATFDANGNTVNFTAGNPNPHQIIVDGTEAKFNDIGILGNTTLSLGSTSANLRLCEVAGTMSIGEGITFTNQSTIGLDFSSATGNIVDIGFISVGGTFINGTGSELDYSSNFTPTVSTFNVATNPNTVLYVNGNASPRNTTYDRLVLRDTRTTTSGIITTNNMTLDQNSPSLTLVDGTKILVNGTLRLVAINPPFATLDFGTGSDTVVVNGDLIATSGTIIHNAGGGKTQLLELKGDINDLGVFTNTSTGISLVKYSSSIIPQTVFPSTNYQNLEIAGGTVKVLQGSTTVNNGLTLTNGVLDLGTGSNILTLGTAATITGTPSTSSYIATTGLGTVNKLISTGTSFTFPVGFGLTGTTDYAPVTTNYASLGASAITAKVAPPSTPTITATNKVNAVWTINGTGLTLGNLVFNWQNVTPTVSSVNSVASGASVYRENSGTWVTPAFDGNSSVVTANSATLTNSTSQTGNFAVFANPVISVSTTTLTAFTTCAGTPSGEQSYTVSGTGLTADISIVPPAGFKISTGTGGSFLATNPIILPQASGTVSPTIIYVRLDSTTAGSYGGTGNDITHTSTGATTQNKGIPASTVNPIPNVTLSILNSPVCPNSDANFEATSGLANYDFYLNNNLIVRPDPTLNTITINGLVTGNQVKVIATNSNGCSNSDFIIMNVADNQAPTLIPLTNFTRNTDAANCYYTNRTTTTSTRIPDGIANDNCGVASYRYRLSGVTLGDLSSLEGLQFNKGVTTVSWTATDRNGNISSSSQFTITVVDAQRPIIQAPRAVTALTDLYSCSSTRTNVNLGTPIVSDNCSYRVSNNAPTEFPLGETIVIWTAVDSAGNRATANQIVTINEQYYVIPSDSLILVQMYNEMGGASWANRWDLNMPVATWNGIAVRCGKIAAINLFNNSLTGTLPRSVLNLARRTESDFSLNIGGNRLSFESAEDFVSLITNFTYSPQAKIYSSRTERIRQSESITFTSQTEGNFNNYQWYKDQTPISGATGWSYTIARAVLSDAGIYVCEVKNTVATQLTLERNPITLEVAGFISPTDSLALVRIFEETGGTTSWTEIWDLTQPVSTWEGVTVVGDKIRELDLSSRNMTGRLPNVFDADLFSELRYLSFFDNDLEGQIPSTIGNITTLTYLDLDKNQFEGALPASFGNLVNLQSLWLSRNNLTSLPDEIGNMRSLRTLYLNDNKFASLPETIGNLSELLVLNVSDNELTGLPNSITSLQKLIQFYANRNYISSIPTDVQNLVDLTVFEINTNNLTALPNGFLQLGNLSNLRVAENQLEFDDLLPYSNRTYSIFDYAPQAPINEEADILVATNSSISFTIQTTGNGNNYQWFRNGTSVATTQNFTISRVTNTDAGLYTAQITNPSLPNLTLQRRSIRLNVECQAGLNFGINQPQQTIFCEGQPFGLKLEINDGLFTTSQIRWKKDGVVLAFANERTYTVTQAGIYTAEIITTNGCTALSNQVEIKVQSKPEVTISLVNEEVLESTLSSQESVTYQWLKNGVPIENAFESTYTPTETAEYSLLVVTQLGCSSVSATIIFTQTVTGIEEPKELRNLAIFPNPNNGTFFIDFGTTTPNGEPSFVLIDAIGRKITLKKERISSTRYKVKTNNLTGGIYYLQIQTKDGLAFRKFVIEE